MNEKFLPEQTTIKFDQIQSTIKKVLLIDNDERPDDKTVQVSVDFMVVPKNININFLKK